MKITYPIRIDPEFFFMAKKMIQENPDLNMRKITHKLSEKKMIIGELFNNKDFENQVNEIYKEMQKRFNI